MVNEMNVLVEELHAAADAAAGDPIRLQALKKTGLLDSPRDPVFDRLTQFAARVLRVRATVMTLIDRDRQFFMSDCGLEGAMKEERGNPLSYSFCKYVVATGQPLKIDDAPRHPLVKNNPAVKMGVGAYVGVPLTDTDGNRIGTLCAFDDKQRSWTTADVEVLSAVAAQIMTELELRARTAQLAMQLKQVQELEQGRRSLTRMTVHDLRTPLCSLLLCLEMLPVLGPLNQPQSEYVSLCARAGDSLRKIVDSLLDIEAVALRGQVALQRSPCDPSDLGQRAKESVLGLASERGIVLSATLPPGLPPILIDQEKMLRVLVNLLGNAIKFTSRGGAVTLSATLASGAVPALVFAVRDTGIGIKQEDLAKIFEEGVCLNPDARTADSIGLGLTYCKKMVETHGGAITVESEFGRGSVFSVTLPLEVSS